MASRKVSVSDKKPQKVRTEGPTQSKSGECEICQSAVEAEDKWLKMAVVYSRRDDEPSMNE